MPLSRHHLRILCLSTLTTQRTFAFTPHNNFSTFYKPFTMFPSWTQNFKHLYKSRSELPKPQIVKDWKKELSDFDYHVLRESGTERPHTGQYCNTAQGGTYKCKACKTPLFTSHGKYPCSCGWPSFFEPVNEDAITYIMDTSHGMQRIETICTQCHSHQGHVFNDGPRDKGGVRYCINSASLEFDKE